MQKSILLILSVILAIHIPAFAQNNKIKVKYAAGQTKINFSPININGRAGLKSANTFYINPGLQPPIIKKTKLHFDKIINTKNGPVYFEIKRTGLKSAPIENISSEKTFNSFMESVNSVINTNNQHSFEIKETQTDELGMIHIRSVQKYKGIPVYGSESGLHISSEKIRFTGNVHNIDQDIDTNPAFTTKKIISIATSDLENETVLTQLSSKQKEILNYEFPECNLIIFKNEQGSYNLAYEIEIRPNFLEVWKYFINAKTGNIIRKFNSTFTDGPVTTTALDLNDILQNINTYLENDLYYLVNTSEDMFNASTGEGMIQTFDANSTSTTNLDYSFITSTDNQWNHPAAISAHYNATITYQYFRNTFNRNSINGQGGSIISLVNVANNDGSSMSNAFWN